MGPRLYFRAGWSFEEEQTLAAGFDAGKIVDELAAAHGRSAYSITSRLVDLQRLVVIGHEYRRVGPCYVTFASLKESQERSRPLADEMQRKRVAAGREQDHKEAATSKESERTRQKSPARRSTK